MPKYKYKAKDLDSSVLAGEIDAKDEADLRRRLREQNLVAVSYSEIEEKHSGYRLKANEVAEFARQLASMLDSGITVVRAMEIIKDRDFKPPIKAVFIKLHKDTQNGFTLSEAMNMQRRAFPELFVNMVASGEASGQLEKSVSKMANNYDKEHRLNGKVKSAMTYPIILLIFTLAVVMFIFTAVLPEFFTLLEGMELPVGTKVIIAISGFLQKYWYIVILAALILIAVGGYLLKIEKVALTVDKIKLKIPKVSGLLRIIYTARFSRTLSSLYSSGLTMLNALDISSTILGNKYIEGQFPDVIKDVRNGETLSDAIGKIDGFDSKLTTTILIGEEAGRLDTMLESVAESFDYEAEMATGRLVQLIEPVMIVIMALIIGSVMLAVMQPLMLLYQNVGSM